MYPIDDDHLQEFPYQLHICERGPCYKPGPEEFGNEDLEQAIAAECGTSPDDIHGKMIEMAGQKFRVECHGCLGVCSSAPAVTIFTEGQRPEFATVTSLEFLKEQAGMIIRGEWEEREFVKEILEKSEKLPEKHVIFIVAKLWHFLKYREHMSRWAQQEQITAIEQLLMQEAQKRGLDAEKIGRMTKEEMEESNKFLHSVNDVLKYPEMLRRWHVAGIVYLLWNCMNHHDQKYLWVQQEKAEQLLVQEANRRGLDVEKIERMTKEEVEEFIESLR